MIMFKMLHPLATPAYLGWLPRLLSENDPRPAKEQFATNYAHGGGWNPFPGHTLSRDGLSLIYAGDPPMTALARAHLRDEEITLFECSWVMIRQKDGSFEIARMD